jgi:hypothetical protein
MPNNAILVNTDGFTPYTGPVATSVNLFNHVGASAGTNGSDITNTSTKTCLKVICNVSAITGTSPTITVTVQGRDFVAGTYYTILASTAVGTTGVITLAVGPGLANVANVSAGDILPATWRVITTIGGTGPAVSATVTAFYGV